MTRLLATVFIAAMKRLANDHRVSGWEAQGCGFLRFDLVPGKALELSKVFHDEIILLAFTDSVWRTGQNGRTYDETPGCVILRDAGQVYSARLDHIAAGGAICREIHLSPTRLQALRQAGEDCLPPFDFHRPMLDRPDLAAQLFDTHSLFEAEGCELASSTALFQLVAGIATASSGAGMRLPRRTCSRRNRMVIDYLRTHFDRKICLPELAELVQINPYVLLRQFRGEVGVTPHDYLLGYRLYRARLYMRAGIRLAEVAVMCGFADQSHFSRQFRQRLGITPGQFLSGGALQ
ncbi:MAG: AraC family transcriptional regulator [Asticcacaulis sp.]|uniref:helix-turn-helix transcriptional regulator n=1 Tax=Asticcacaulis sp. TaxID=1872648 RepID=UPI0039E5E518